MENSGQSIIQSLRKKVEDDAQRKSERIQIENNLNEDPNQKRENKSINIFANIKKETKINLFGNQRKSVNLFDLKPKTDAPFDNSAKPNSTNIFNMKQKPAVENNDEQQQSQADLESQQLQKSQLQFKSEPKVKEMKYEYKNQLQKLHQVQLKKFKSGISLARQQIYLTLQFLPNQSNILYLIIRSSATKVIVYQGIMIKNISKPEHFMGKPNTAKFQVARKSSDNNGQEDKSDKKLQRQIVKLQFNNDEQCLEFIQKVNNYFHEQK